MTNPYASPVHVTEKMPLLSPAETAAESIRKRHLVHEQSLRQSTLCVTGLFLAITPIAIFMLDMTLQSWLAVFTIIVLIVAMSVGSLLGLICCWGVARLNSWARVPTFVLAVMALPIAPFGTGFGFSILLALLSGPQPKLLTANYELIVSQTKQLNTRTSLLSWVGLALILLIIMLLVVISQLPEEFRRP